ncbi:arginase family protein [Paenibacillus sp. ClWae2A]|uniref:arginase family protein n=1 Tax=Paenibacillus sp. ClWae2A TaxID=3057177 RepID=UPI0028F545C3|nr:arginase family protein [Paenibacillus sp. ClWae2A]MDT9722404.1 arginase family protein [Paenibacillus sp. ClWae2A]
MKTSEPAYLVRRIADAWIAADETFSQFYELEPAKELEPQLPPDLPGVEPAQSPFFLYEPLIGHQAPQLGILGIPYSGGTSMLNSSVAGLAHALRVESWKKVIYPSLQESGNSSLYDIGSGRRLLERVAMQDWGTCLMNEAEADTAVPYQKGLDAALDHALDQQALLCCIGGDHSITHAVLHMMAKALGSRRMLVQFDAHHDCGIDAIHQENPSHSNFVRHLLEQGTVAAVVQIGLRGLRSADQMYSHPGLIQISAEHMTPERVSHVLNEVRQKYDVDSAYLTFDLDSLDPGSFPFVDFPIAAGPTWQNIRDCVIAALEVPIAYQGMDMVEGQGVQSDRHIPGQYELALRMLAYMVDGIDRNRRRFKNSSSIRVAREEMLSGAGASMNKGLKEV